MLLLIGAVLATAAPNNHDNLPSHISAQLSPSMSDAPDHHAVKAKVELVSQFLYDTGLPNKAVQLLAVRRGLHMQIRTDGGSLGVLAAAISEAERAQLADTNTDTAFAIPAEPALPPAPLLNPNSFPLLAEGSITQGVLSSAASSAVESTGNTHGRRRSLDSSRLSHSHTHSGNVRVARHVWGSCVSPPTGDTTTRFHYRVNTNHPTPESGWSLLIAGPTTLNVNWTGASTWLPSGAPEDSECQGEQAFWFTWGPFVLTAGTYSYQFVNIGDGNSPVLAGPPVAQGRKLPFKDACLCMCLCLRACVRACVLVRRCVRECVCL
jgi:hypothetical protein